MTSPRPARALSSGPSPARVVAVALLIALAVGALLVFVHHTAYQKARTVALLHQPEADPPRLGLLERELDLAAGVAAGGTVLVLLVAGVAIAFLFVRHGRAQALAERSFVFGESPQPMWVYDRETLAFLEVNDAAVDHYGYSRREFLSMTIADIRPPEDVPALLEDVAHVVPGFTRNDRWRHRKKDGSLIDVEIVSHPVTVSGRQAEFILAHDVTDRKRAEKEAALLAHAIRSISECVSITDERNTILFVNEAFLRTYGYLEEELVGRPIRVVSGGPPEGWPEEEILQGTIGGRWQGELINRRKDGTEFPISLSTSVVRDETGTPIALIGVATDVTERRRAEAEILRLNSELEERVRSRTAELEAANRELEAFSHSVSHDLRAPLRAINGYAWMLLDSHGARLDAEAKRLLGVIQENSLRMAHLIDDLLALSRVGRQQMRSIHLDVSEVAAAAWEEVLAHDPSPPATLRLASLPEATGDPALLRQVFVNLLANALKFSSKRELREVTVGGGVRGAESVYFVQDNGAGFDPAYAAKLFEVFERLHGQREYPGTGVGLSIVKRIVERHGGRVWAEGAPGAGATFSFALPRGEECVAAGDPAADGSPDSPHRGAPTSPRPVVR